MATTAAPAKPAVNVGQIVSRITRDQKPEFEQSLTFTALTQVSTPTSLRTDRKIKWFYLQFRGRLTNSGSPGTYRTNTLLGTSLFSLIQQFDYRGQHLRYGAQTPVIMRGEFAAEMMALLNPNWVPRWTVSVNGAAAAQGAALSNSANATNDVDFSLPIPTFPYDTSPADQPFYSLHGPDWPGNIYMDVLCADPTALGVTTAQCTLSAYNSSSGSPTINILSVRPLLGKGLASQVRPAVTFRVQNFNQPTAAVQGAGGTGIKLADLTVGKDTCRVALKVGTLQSSPTPSSGVVVYASLSDAMITRFFVSLDNRQLNFQPANGCNPFQCYASLSYGRSFPVGYRIIDYISGAGPGTANPKASFQSSQLTAARKFELDGDVSVAASTEGAEMIQEMLLGQPAMLSAS